MSKLVFIGEKFGGRVYEFAMEKTTVGRGEHNTLVIRDDTVSSSHCELIVNGAEVIVHDLGSANGTFVSGARVNGQCQLKNEQVVRFGSVEARLALDVQKWEDTTAEETAVIAMQRIMRDQRREKNKPKPADPSMRLETGEAPELGDHTVVMPRPAASPERLPLLPSEPQSSPAASRLWMVVVAVLAGAAALVYWLVTRKS